MMNINFADENDAVENQNDESANEESQEESQVEEASIEAPAEEVPAEAAAEEALMEELYDGTSDLLNFSTKQFIRDDIPSFRPGDTISIGVKVVEGGKTRIQNFEGIVIALSGSKMNRTFTIRKISNGIGVERIFPLNSPNFESLKVTKKGKVRRAKLYYLRNLKGKAASRIKERV